MANNVISVGQTMAECVYLEAKQLLVNGPTTTLDIKEKCIQEYPQFYWTQTDVSNIMNRLYQSGSIHNLSFTDNGVYRTYTTQTKTAPSSKTRLNRLDLVKKVLSSPNCMMEVSFIKKDGSNRDLEGVFEKMDELGFLKEYFKL